MSVSEVWEIFGGKVVNILAHIGHLLHVIYTCNGRFRVLYRGIFLRVSYFGEPKRVRVKIQETQSENERTYAYLSCVKPSYVTIQRVTIVSRH